jgi:hypothetical protein
MSLNCDLFIRRKWFSTKSTIGQIIGINTNDQSEVLSYCLEDESRGKGVKIYGCTCISDGEYFVKITYSERFKRELPIIYNKEVHEGKPYVIFDGRNSWEGVRIHPGNTDADTFGCILPGTTKGKNIVGESRSAFDNRVFPFIMNHPALKGRGYLVLKIVNEQEA